MYTIYFVELMLFGSMRVCFFALLNIAGAIGGIGGAETFDTILTSVNCQGTESSILDCPAMNSTECVSQEIATVICQGRKHTWGHYASTLKSG